MSKELEDHEIIKLLASMVRSQSVNPPGDEYGVAKVLADWLRERGVEVEIELVSENRANLSAKVSGSASVPSLAFCGHMDTVPIGNSLWQFEPFGAQIVGGRMYGRGTADMKASLAAMAGALVSLHQHGSQLTGDVYLFCTAGEEVDSIGARKFIDQGAFDRVGAFIIGEPTGMQLAIAHKGALWVRITFRGRMAHGSTPHLGSNAILSACNFQSLLVEHKFLAAEHPLLGGPTINPGMIRGGISINVVPDYCELFLDIRTVPGLEHKSVLEDLNVLLSKMLPEDELHRVEVTVVLDRAPVSTEQSEAIVQTALEAGRYVLGKDLSIKGMTYYTDASVIVPATKKPVVIWGCGNIEQAHQVNEFVEIEDVLTMKRLYEQVALCYRGN